jgi:hypothetical protein
MNASLTIKLKLYICKMIFIKRLLLVLLFPLLILSSCKKDALLTDSTAKLGFSADTVLFDTVFTTVGSVTKQFKIYNPHNQTLNISRIFLATGSNSQYRINVDGVSATMLKDVEIMGGDSLYVFVQVTVNPTNQSSPLLIRDSIIFETNGNIQDVKLIAIGQNVYLHKPSPGKFYSITGREGHDTTLPNDKPHLFFGYVVVDANCILTIQAGTHIYMHNKAVLWVYKDGTLKVEGTHGNEVTFQGDRLEAEYKDIPGQWGKIWLSPGSKDNKIDWAIIKNGSIGVQADTLNILSTNPTLQINNTIIKNMEAAAIYGQGSFIRSYNCVFANCGQYVAALTIGGRYSFQQCTFANFWNRSQRTTPLLALNNYYISSGNVYVVRSLDSAYFGNCILYGDLSEEVGQDSSIYGGNFSYKFDHCIVKTNLNTANGFHFNVVYKNNDPGFKDQDNNDYELISSAFAIDKGDPAITIPTDLNNSSRPNGASLPDLGAYEFH